MTNVDNGRTVRFMDASEAICAFDGCGKPARAKELCWGHYQQLRRGRELKPLRQRRRPDSTELRIASRVLESGFDTSVIAGEAKLTHCEVIDWIVTRAPEGDDGPRIARTVAEGSSLRAYWFDSYLNYAPSEEFVETSSLVCEAILGKYDGVPPPLYFEKATITKSMEDACNDRQSV